MLHSNKITALKLILNEGRHTLKEVFFFFFMKLMASLVGTFMTLPRTLWCLLFIYLTKHIQGFRNSHKLQQCRTVTLSCAECFLMCTRTLWCSKNDVTWPTHNVLVSRRSFGLAVQWIPEHVTVLWCCSVLIFWRQSKPCTKPVHAT